MPLANQRKAIRFATLRSMHEAIEADRPYQYRHLVLRELDLAEAPKSRKQISEAAGIPINLMSNAVKGLLDCGAIEGGLSILCPLTGREVQGLKLRRDYCGLY